MRRRQVLAALGGAGTGSFAGCLAGRFEDDCPPRPDAEPLPDGWPMPGFDQENTSVGPDGFDTESDGDPDETREPSEIERWRVDLWDETHDDVAGATSAPVVDDERVYVTYGLPDGWNRDIDGRLFALEETTGRIDWEYALSGHAGGAPVLVGDGVLVGDADGTLARLERESGDIVWETDLGSAVRTPAVADGWCYVQSDDGRVHAIDAETGESCWVANAGGLLERVGFGDEYETQGRPAITDDAVVVTTSIVDDSRETPIVRVLERASGEQRWATELDERLDDAPRSPAVADGTVYVPGDERLHAYALADGEREWTFATGHATSTPAVGDDTVYCSAKNVYAIDRDDGTERWRHVNLASESYNDSRRVPLTVQPAVAGDRVVVGFGALERETGRHLWGDVGNDLDSEYFSEATSLLGAAMGGRAIANGALYATMREGRIAKVVP